jgi:predicted negative regulator of RcsB-dependent stress response
MANHLDLEEQEQLDQLKHFWKQYGNQLTWLLIIVLGAFAAWNGYQYWQKNQAAQASVMFDEVTKVARGAEPEKVERAFNDMKERFASATYTHQAGLLAAKALVDAGKPDGAKAILTWVSEKSGDVGYASIARLRLSALLMDAKSYDEAFKVIDSVDDPAFGALASDRRGDIFMAQGKKSEAKAEYLKAYKAFDDRVEYRRLVEVKLNSLGVNPVEDTQAAVDKLSAGEASK